MTELLDRIPGRYGEIVGLARQLARQKGQPVFLVGGPLRDLLLGRALQDLDFTLQSGAEQFTRALAERLGGTVHSFPQFLTHKIDLSDLPAIDVATTRREEYRPPGSLPVVSESSLADDLRRRDFTINAMALDITSGQLHDPFEGQLDMRQRWIRVLHDLSFSDDPTRLYRAIRLAVRLDFRMEPRTREHLREAIDGEFAGTVSRERLWREFFLAFKETDRARVLFEFANSLSLRVLLGGDPVDARLLDRLQNADRLLRRFGGDEAVAFLAVLMIDRALGNQQAGGSGLSRTQLEKIQAIASTMPLVLSKLQQAQSEHERFDLFAKASPELGILCAVEDGDLETALGRYHQYRKLELGIRGDELEVPSGPHVGVALEQTRRALFFGEITPDQARAFARRKALEYLGRNVP